jgi:hypothetical protein
VRHKAGGKVGIVGTMQNYIPVDIYGSCGNLTCPSNLRMRNSSVHVITSIEDASFTSENITSSTYPLKTLCALRMSRCNCLELYNIMLYQLYMDSLITLP